MFDSFSRLFSRTRKSSRISPKKRNLRLELLEDRTLLSISPADIQHVKSLFPDYEIPENATFYEITSFEDSGSGTLRDAILQSAQTEGDDIILLRPEALGLNASSPLFLNSNEAEYGRVTIVGMASRSGIAGQFQTQILNISNSAHVQIGGLNLMNGGATAGQNGGAISAVDSTVSLSNVQFNQNKTSGTAYQEYGGAMYQQGGSSVLNNVSFIGNSSVHGAAFAIVGGSTVQTNVRYSSNWADAKSAECWGGAIYAKYANVTLVNAEMTWNSALLGSAMHLISSDTTVLNSTITNNTGSFRQIYVTWDSAVFSSLTLRNSIVLSAKTDAVDIGINVGTPIFDNNIIGSYVSNYTIDPVANRLGMYAYYDVFNAAGSNQPTSLNSGSPAIDAGTNSYILERGVTTDIAGNARIQGGNVDLGARETAGTIIAAPPVMPTNLTATLWQDDNTIRLAWDAASENAEYALYRSMTANGPWEKLGKNVVYQGTENAFTDSGLAEYQRYYYRVSGINKNGVESEFSGIVYATTMQNPLRADLTPFKPEDRAAPLVVKFDPFDNSVNIDWAIKNIGTAYCDAPFAVQIYIDGVSVWEDQFSSGIPMNSLFTGWANIPVSYLANDTHTIELRVDPYDTLTELNESNNVYSTTFTLLPDLTPFTPPGWEAPVVVTNQNGTSDLYANEPILIDFAFKDARNLLAGTETAFWADLYLDGVRIWNYYFPQGALLHQGFAIENFYVNGVSAGTHTLELYVDQVNKLTESNETNNVYTKTFTVFPKYADLTPFTPDGWDAPIVVSTQSGTHTDSPVVYAYQQIYVDFAFKNIGEWDTNSPIYANLYLDGVQIVSECFYNGVSADSIRFSFDNQIGGLSVGLHTIELRIDENNALTESNETNNVYTKTFTVFPKYSDLTPFTQLGWDAPLVVSTQLWTYTDSAVIYEKEPIYIDFAFKNIGEWPTDSPIYANLYLDGLQVVSEYFYNGISPNSMRFSIDNQIGGLSVGLHTLELRIDEANALIESDETNNVYTKTFTVLQAIPLAPVGLSSTLTQNGKLRLSWSPAEKASEYTVYCKFGGVNTVAFSTTETYYEFANPYNYASYEWGVTARNGSGESPISVSQTFVTPPLAPASVSAAVSGANSVAVSWAAGLYAANYTLERRALGSESNWTAVYTGSARSFTDANLTYAQGTTLEYRVKAANNGGVSDYSVLASATLPISKLNAPTNLSLYVKSTAQIDVEWQPVDGASSYRVERAAAGTTTWTAVYTGTATEFSNTNLGKNATYQYRVFAIGSQGTSSASAIVSAATQKNKSPDAPNDLRVAAQTANSVSVAWTDKSTDETEFIVRWTTDGTNWSSASVSANATAYTISALKSGTAYTIEVSANNKFGQSGWTKAVSAKTAVPSTNPPIAPTNLSVSGKTANTISVAWTDKSTDETSFVVRWSADGSNWSSASVASNTTAYSISGLKSGTAYFVQVSASNANGQSAWTASVSAQTDIVLLNPPLAPTNIQLSTKTGNSMSVAWSDLAYNETGYKIEWSTDGVTWNTMTVSANSTSTTITGLKKNTTYSVRVVAFNDVGLSDLNVLTHKL